MEKIRRLKPVATIRSRNLMKREVIVEGVQ